MDYYGSKITNLIDELARLPGIGRKSAQRLAFHIIDMKQEEVVSLSQALITAREGVRYCARCCTLTDEELCPICADPRRDQSVIMVVEDSRDMAADTARGVNSESGYGDVTLSKGFYLLISETSVQANFSGRTFARFKSNNANVMGNNTFVPPTINGYGYLQLVQFVNVTSSANVGRYYYDTVQSASSHLWRVYKLFG